MTFPQILAPWRWLPRTNETLFDYWLSLSPAAPYFGVAWRFADDGETAVLSPKTKAATEPAAPAPKIDRASAQTVEPVAAEDVTGDVSSAPEADLRDMAGDATDGPVPEAPEHPATEPESPASARELAPEPAPDEPVNDASMTAPDALRPTVLLDARPADIDDLKRIKGVGPKLEADLNALGIWRFDQVAGLRETDLLWLDARLPTLRGRPARDNWVDQAVRLMSQDATAG